MVATDVVARTVFYGRGVVPRVDIGDQRSVVMRGEHGKTITPLL
jgi:hypothetical protein